MQVNTDFILKKIVRNDYCAFGAPMPGRTFSSPSYRYGFNGKEKDNEINGTGNDYDFDARIYDSRLGRWLSIDKHSRRYPSESNYIFVSNNPIIYLDADGNDKVYFDCEGNETSRIESKIEFITYVQVAQNVTYDANGTIHSIPVYEVAPMPGVIDGKEDPKYQKLDYQIAASTFIFNQNLKDKSELPATENHQTTEDTKTPQIDVNLVKSMIMEESQMGESGPNKTGDTDPMQSNYPGDYAISKDVKKAAGLIKNQVMTPRTSINGGLKILFLKGMISNSKGNYTTWRGDQAAVEKYNGGGSPGYAARVLKSFNSIKPAKPDNYNVKPKPDKKKK